MSKKLKEKETDQDKEKESQSYQQMLEEVDGIVRSVSGGPLDLDEVVSRVERGYKLIKQMRERLDNTKSKVERLRTEFENDAVPAKEEEKPRAKAAVATPPPVEDDEDDTPF